MICTVLAPLQAVLSAKSRAQVPAYIDEGRREGSLVKSAAGPAALAASAEAAARTITDARDQARTLCRLAQAAIIGGKPDHARRRLALAIIAETPDISSWMEVVARLFPAVIQDAADMFLEAYKAE
jgi:hypothetical protein